MNRFRRCSIAIELLASLVLGSACVANPFREMIVFGDSLSDTGNAATRYRERVFPPPYAAGRWSNGPMWVEVLADRLGLPRPVDSSQGGTNYAWGGGTTGTIAGLGVSMQAQVQKYLRSHTPLEDELFVILGGVNDFFRGQSDPLAPARKLVELITQLRDAGARNFLVGNLPETVGIYPALNQALARNVPAFNAELWSSLDQLASSTEGLRITKFDFHGLYGEIAADPAAYGLANVEQPACIECGAWDGGQKPSGFVFGNVVPNPDEYYLWDDVHPSTAAHRLMGEAAFAALVPEPCTATILAIALLPTLLGRSYARAAATQNHRRLVSSAGPCLALGGLPSGCRRMLLAKLVLLVLLIASPSMSVAARYSGIVAFGDSITDVGNWAIHAGLPGGVFPPQYAGGRLSNGSLWIEHLAERMGVSAPTPSLSGGTNYAWAGGTTGSRPSEDVNMDYQVRSYLSQRTPDADELFVLWGGANDFFGGQTDPAAPARFIGQMVEDLAAGGGRHFLVVNLPLYFGTYLGNAQLRRHAAEFNAELALVVDALRAARPDIRLAEFDYFTLFERVRAAPADFGFANVLNPACRGCYGSNPLVVPDADSYYFWDDAHPTAAAHRLIGAGAYAALVPEPNAVVLVILFANTHTRRHSKGPSAKRGGRGIRFPGGVAPGDKKGS